ncbi:2-dehydropantoate 2-reductase [Aquimarina gracilis]|uniref:2-dehydropantoate 2-reductase n=1 Tax=Aquimarina gracilis TaxID=874422 RepID=A0ABU6A2E9_9FLAO|nr:2-dehydropantoate 2-reductase [Aquimarina gracilis]MEB3348230.1 2-dehydropantoate 2-reductase [Aquimarina gracilis]
MQTHIIFGAGLIGCFLGGVLTSLGQKTKLVCRPHIKEKLSNGLKLTDYLGHASETKNLNFLDSKDLKTNNENFCDFLWITVKCTGVDQASKDIRPLVGPDTILLCCQNGLGSDHIIKQQYPNNRVLRVMVPFNVAEIKPGHLHRGSEGDLSIEVTLETEDIIGSLTNQIHCNLMPVIQTDEMQALLWAKLQLNLGNSVNALANIPVKAMLQQRKYRLVIAALMKELLWVTKALHIDLPKVTALPGKYLPFVLSLPNFLFNLVANKMLAIDPTVRTSMWWDLSQGKKTEIDYLNGAIVSAAKELNIPCPANNNIISFIKLIENSGAQNPGIPAAELFEKIRTGS